MRHIAAFLIFSIASPLAVAQDEKTETYVQVPGMRLAVKTDGNWKSEFVHRDGSQLWIRLNDKGINAGSIMFRLIPRFSKTPREQSEVGHEYSKKTSIYVKDGKHSKPFQMDGRTAHMFSYFSKRGKRSIYAMQVTVEYDDKQYLLATCGYEIGLIDDISDEQLTKLKQIRFLPKPVSNSKP